MQSQCPYHFLSYNRQMFYLQSIKLLFDKGGQNNRFHCNVRSNRDLGSWLFVSSKVLFVPILPQLLLPWFQEEIIYDIKFGRFTWGNSSTKKLLDIQRFPCTIPRKRNIQIFMTLIYFSIIKCYPNHQLASDSMYLIIFITL